MTHGYIFKYYSVSFHILGFPEAFLFLKSVHLVFQVCGYLLAPNCCHNVCVSLPLSPLRNIPTFPHIRTTSVFWCSQLGFSTLETAQCLATFCYVIRPVFWFMTQTFSSESLLARYYYCAPQVSLDWMSRSIVRYFTSVKQIHIRQWNMEAN